MTGKPVHRSGKTDTVRSSGSVGRLEGLGAVVTGSSTGIGETIARTLAAAGAGVVVCGRDRTRADNVASSIRSVGGRAFSAVADLAGDPTNIREFARAAAAELDGQVDILVNNAAFYPVTATEALPDTDLNAMLAVNVRAPHVLV